MRTRIVVFSVLLCFGAGTRGDHQTTVLQPTGKQRVRERGDLFQTVWSLIAIDRRCPFTLDTRPSVFLPNKISLPPTKSLALWFSFRFTNKILFSDKHKTSFYTHKYRTSEVNIRYCTVYVGCIFVFSPSEHGNIIRFGSMIALLHGLPCSIDTCVYSVSRGSSTRVHTTFKVEK